MAAGTCTVVSVSSALLLAAAVELVPFTVGFLIAFSCSSALSLAAAALLLSASMFFCSSKTKRSKSFLSQER